MALYQEKYFDFSVLHFHEKLRKEHGFSVSYSWVRQALQGAGLVKKRSRRGTHRRRNHEDRCQGCCCTLMGASISGCRMGGITT